jgi:hypothetical protein
VRTQLRRRSMAAGDGAGGASVGGSSPVEKRNPELGLHRQFTRQDGLAHPLASALLLFYFAVLGVLVGQNPELHTSSTDLAGKRGKSIHRLGGHPALASPSRLSSRRSRVGSKQSTPLIPRRGLFFLFFSVCCVRIPARGADACNSNYRSIPRAGLRIPSIS